MTLNPDDLRDVAAIRAGARISDWRDLIADSLGDSFYEDDEGPLPLDEDWPYEDDDDDEDLYAWGALDEYSS